MNFTSFFVFVLLLLPSICTSSVFSSLPNDAFPSAAEISNATTTYFGHFTFQRVVGDARIGAYAYFWLLDDTLRLRVEASSTFFTKPITTIMMRCSSPGAIVTCGKDVATCNLCIDFGFRVGVSTIPFTYIGKINDTSVIDLIRGGHVAFFLLNSVEEENAFSTPAVYFQGEQLPQRYAVFGGSVSMIPPLSPPASFPSYVNPTPSLNVGIAFFWMQNYQQIFTSILTTIAPGELDIARFFVGNFNSSTMSADSCCGLTDISPGTVESLTINPEETYLQTIKYLEQFSVWIGIRTTASVWVLRGQIYPMFVPIITSVDKFDVNMDVKIPFRSDAMVTIAMNFGQQNSFGNEIWITFPKSWHLYNNSNNNNNGISSSSTNTTLYLVAGTKYQPSSFKTTYTKSKNPMVILRWNDAIAAPLNLFNNATISDSTISVTVNHVGLPRDCENLPFQVETHDCFYDNVLNASVSYVKKCRANSVTDFLYFKKTAQGFISDCTSPCPQCKYLYTSASTGDKYYTCSRGGIQFFKTNIDLSHSSNNNGITSSCF